MATGRLLYYVTSDCGSKYGLSSSQIYYSASDEKDRFGRFILTSYHRGVVVVDLVLLPHGSGSDLSHYSCPINELLSRIPFFGKMNWLPRIPCSPRVADTPSVIDMLPPRSSTEAEIRAEEELVDEKDMSFVRKSYNGTSLKVCSTDGFSLT